MQCIAAHTALHVSLLAHGTHMARTWHHMARTWHAHGTHMTRTWHGQAGPLRRLFRAQPQLGGSGGGGGGGGRGRRRQRRPRERRAGDARRSGARAARGDAGAARPRRRAARVLQAAWGRVHGARRAAPRPVELTAPSWRRCGTPRCPGCLGRKVATLRCSAHSRGVPRCPSGSTWRGQLAWPTSRVPKPPSPLRLRPSIQPLQAPKAA